MAGGSNRKLLFSVKVGKSYKNRGWAVKRESAISLIPKLSYEDECDIVVDGIHSKARLNIVPRIFYKDAKLSNHLENLANKGIDRIDLELLLNHSDGYVDNLNFNRKFDDNAQNKFNSNKSISDCDNVKLLLNDKNEEIKLLQNEINALKSSLEDMDRLREENIYLKKLSKDQNNEIDNLFESIVQLEYDIDEMSKKRKFYEHENKRLNDKLERLSEIMYGD